MNQQHLSALDFFPEASDLILSLTSEEADELMKTLRPLAVMPEDHGDYPAARIRFVIYGRLRKLAHEAAKVEELLGERVLDAHSQYLSLRTNCESVSASGIRASAGKRVLFPARLPQRASKPSLCRVVLSTLA
jgi:hypothetical protein